MAAVGEKPKILVVDDEAQIARVLKTTLSARGYSIRTASDGDDALQVMKSWTPDLVITDLRMPNMDGVELCRHLRAKSGIPIIVLSATQPLESDVVEIGHFRIDTQAHSVQVKGRDVRLTPKEFDILTYLARHSERVVTHRALLAAVWGDNSTEQPEYLRVFIGHLRKKLEPDEASPRYITTEPWVGYRFNPE